MWIWIQRGVASEIFKFDPVHSQPSGTYSQDLPAMPSNLNIFGSTLTVKGSCRPVSKCALARGLLWPFWICQGVADDMLCINFQWNLLARSCKGHQFCYQARHPKFCALKLWGLLWACLDVQRKQLQNPEEEVPEVPWYWIRIQGLLPNVVLQGCFTDSGTERSYLLWYALMQTLSGSLPEPNVQQNWPCGFISHSDCAVSVQVSKDITTYNVVVY